MVNFLQDPTVASSPVERRIAFLQSKNLTQDELDVALARAGETQSAPNPMTQQTPSDSNHEYQPPPWGYGGYHSGYRQQSPPPEPPRRDWRDWFIMATVMGGVSYGLYSVAQRYVYPLIAPPTPPQLEQDKKAVDESFAKAFALLDQLATDTETLKASEEARTQRLDTALAEVESVMGELKIAGRRREDEGRRISDEVRGLKDLIPKAMEAQKENADGRLRELNTEMRSLKTLMGARLGPSTGGVGGSGRTLGSSSFDTANNGAVNGSGTNRSLSSGIGGGGGSAPNAANTSPADSQSSSAAIPTPGSPGAARKDSQATLGGSASSGRAAIPAWQLAAANKSKSPSSATSSTVESGSAIEAADGA
ncbi:MAG: peroxisomal membrane protein pex14 [Candelina submexicana]|nr:MAG: peroxisomal membrane protein pex14 [Candelina submexicana]